MDSQTTVVSVAVITYNHEKYLRQALDSILMQKVNFKYEVIVGEDSSPDGSRNILKEYEKKYPHIFKMVYRNNNIGATKNLYDILTKCRGKYIASLEGDDYWIDDKKLQVQVDFLENNEDYIGVCGLTNEINECESILSVFPEIRHVMSINKNMEFEDAGEYLKFKRKYNSEDFHINTLLYRNVLKKDKEKKQLKELITKTKYIADDQTKIFLLCSGKIKVLNKVAANYRHIIKSGTSFSAQSVVDKFNDTKLAFELSDEYSLFKYHNEIQKYINKITFVKLIELFNEKNYESFNKLMRENFSLLDYAKFLLYFVFRAMKKIVRSIMK